MFQFVYWLKAFAAIFITNSHYADIWPVPSLAIGGHLGNCIYFFVSGFCLYNIKESFPKWYAKRIIRIYPALWIVATVDFIVGRNSADDLMALIHCYIYPTWYHFIGSIMFLYIIFYVIRFVGKKAISSFEILNAAQIFLPIVQVLLIASIGVVFIKLEKKKFFDSVNKKLSKVVIFLSKLTLEIYFCQELVLYKFSDIIFPIDFIVVTIAIILYAWIVHKCSIFIQKKCCELLRL